MRIFKFSNIIFISGLLFSIFVLFYSIYRTFNPQIYFYQHATVSISPEYYTVYLIISLILIFFFIFCLKLDHNKKINVSLLLSTIIISLYIFEFYLWNFDKLNKIKNNTIIHQINILNDLRNKNIDAYLNYFPKNLLENISTINGLKYKEEIIFPINGIGNITSISNNEHGYNPIIAYDEYGFNNPKGIYDDNKKIDIIMVGDSFAEGVSVNSEDSIQASLRKSNYNTLSIARGGSGPLMQLASIKEYAEILKPKVVLWFFFENDINDLKTELKSSTLVKYMNDENYSQKLISKQKQINFILKKYLKNKEIKFLKNINQSSQNFNEVKKFDSHRIIKNIIYFTKLTKLRKRLGILDYIKLFTLPPSVPHPWLLNEDTPIKEFEHILKNAKKLVSSWEGKIYLVYIPYKSTYYKNASRHPISKHVFETTNKLNIPVIDLHTKVLINHPRPFLLYEDHFNVNGYKFISEGLIKELKKENIIPSK